MSEPEPDSETDAALEEYTEALTAQYFAKTRVRKAKEKIAKLAKKNKTWVLWKSDNSFNVKITPEVGYPIWGESARKENNK